MTELNGTPVGKMPIFQFSLEDMHSTRGLEYFINEQSVRVSVEVSSGFAALANQYLTQRGKASWSIPLRHPEAQRNFSAFFNRVMEANDHYYFPFVYDSRGNSATDESQMIRFKNAIHGNRSESYVPSAFATIFRRELSEECNYSLPNKADIELVSRIPVSYFTPTYALGKNEVLLIKDHNLGGNINITIDNNDVAWVRPVMSHSLKEFITEEFSEDTRLLKRHKNWILLSPQEVQKFSKRVENTNMLSMTTELQERLEASDNVIGIGSYPGEGSSVAARVGINVNTRKFRLQKGPQKISMKQAEKINKELDVEVLFHPELDDVISMGKAKLFKQKNLRDYQKDAVGLHLSTGVGYVQTCSTGMGKTVIQLTAMRERAKNIENYRGLVVCEANVRKQWKEEAEIWFPEAEVVILTAQKDVDKLNRALATSGKPIIIMTSYALTTPIQEYMTKQRLLEVDLRAAVKTKNDKVINEILSTTSEMTLANLLVSTHWDDLCADEAVVIRTGSSKQCNSMWELRRRASVAVPMSATPINTSVDDLLRLVAWARGNRTMFSGIEFEYDTGTAEGAKQMFNALQPFVFRRDTSEVEDEIPTSLDKMELLTPSAPERALINAAENELKRCYLELMAAMDDVEKTGKADAEELAQARLSLREANGAWLGGKQLARIATSDPSALLHSASMGAALLQSQGLIEAASQTEPTKLKYFMKEAHERVLKGEKIVVFTSFNSVANSLTKALTDAGINAKSFTGKNSRTRDAARQEFQRGELDVLVSTKAGTRGLTLHRANAIYHYDIPYTLEEIIQRIGRGVRIGSENEKVDIVFMIMKDTVEHRVAEHIVGQGIKASLILDHSRDSDLNKTETASAISGLLGAATSLETGTNQNVLDFGKILGISEDSLLSHKELQDA